MRFSFTFADRLFALRVWVARLAARRKYPVKFAARLVGRMIGFYLAHVSGNRIITSRLLGRTFLMPASHFLPATLAEYPQYNSPLVLALEAILHGHSSAAPLSVIDVGANIGDTVAILEHYHPGKCSYFCIEPDVRLAALCERNWAANRNVTTCRRFIGDREDLSVRLVDDGRANPSIRTVTSGSAEAPPLADNRLMSLDSVATDFCRQSGRLDLIKVDTEGFDFSVIRSGAKLLAEYKPALYFEWYPHLLRNAGEEDTSLFPFLAKLGYRYFVLFTELGYYYCTVDDPSELFLRSLSSIATSSISPNYFDVFVCTQKSVRDHLVESCIEALKSDFARFARK